MKKFLFAALGAGLLMTSCQSDEPLAPGNGTAQQVAFTVSLPDVASTRAGGESSALGGVSNNINADVTFNVALYLGENLVYAHKQTVSSTGNHTSATFEPTLVIGEQYRVVAFAEFDNDVVATGEGENPATNMENVTMEKGINNEKNDEYFVTTTVTAAPELSAELKRPYGKLRLIAEDLAEAERQFGAAIDSVEVKYAYTRPASFNVLNGAFASYTLAEETFNAEKCVYADETGADRTIFVDYIPANTGDQMMPFTVKVTFANGKTYTREFRQDIPVRRNWLTTLKGRLFTMDSELKLTIEENFDGETNIDYVLATTAAELKDALENAEEGSTILLQENVNYGTVTIGELKNVTIKGSENSTMRFVTNANTKIENVTVKDMDFEFVTGAGQKNGAFVVIDATAQIENLVVENCNIVGDGKKNSYGIFGQNANASIVVRNCNFSNLGYAIQAIAGGGYKSLLVENCSFDNMNSWVIMPQYGYSGDLTINGCTFNQCSDGLVKTGAFNGSTFTFTNNTITASAGHDGKDSKWFEVNASASTKVITGNTKDGAAWTPDAANGLK